MPDETLLIVEDHDVLREGLQILLESEGYQVISAAHGLGSSRKDGKNHAGPNHVRHIHAGDGWVCLVQCGPLAAGMGDNPLYIP